MKHKSWEWEVRLVTESDPYIIHTNKDSALVAMEQFEETWGSGMSVYSLRKTAEIIRFESKIKNPLLEQRVRGSE